MDAIERKSLAEQLNANPLMALMLDEIEKRWIDAMVNSATDEGRLTAQAQVRAVRLFRNDLTGMLSTRSPKAEPV
jgi:hypothetical protein